MRTGPLTVPCPAGDCDRYRTLSREFLCPRCWSAVPPTVQIDVIRTRRAISEDGLGYTAFYTALAKAVRHAAAAGKVLA